MSAGAAEPHAEPGPNLEREQPPEEPVPPTWGDVILDRPDAVPDEEGPHYFDSAPPIEIDPLA